MLTIEAVLAALVIVSAGAFVAGMAPPASRAAAPERLDALTQDAMVGLQLDPSSSLEALAADVYACDAPDAAQARCDQMRRRLEVALAPYLPQGTQFELRVGNGLSTVAAGAPGAGASPSATASTHLSPRWNLSFVVPELSCHDPALGMRVHVLPLRAGASPKLRNLTLSSPELGAHVIGADVDATGWRLGLVEGNATHTISSLHAHGESRSATYAATASVAPCALGTEGVALQTALRASSFSFDADGASGGVPGSDIRLRYDLSPLGALAPVVTVRQVDVEIDHPIVPSSGTAPAALRAAMGSGTTGTLVWSTPAAAPFGHHPAVLRVGLDVQTTTGVVSLEARLVALIPLTLPNGNVPDQPLYRISITTWEPGWE